MGKQQIIPYRGDFASARLGFKQQKRKALRKFKRKFLNLYEKYCEAKGVILWSHDKYVHDDFRKLLGLEPNFFDETAGNGVTCTGFWVKLTPSINAESAMNLSLENKKLFYKRAFRVFNKYGKRIEINYRVIQGSIQYDEDGEIIDIKYEYNYKVFKYDDEKKEYIETSFDQQEKDEISAKDLSLAMALYSRMVSDMIYKNIDERRLSINHDVFSNHLIYNPDMKKEEYIYDKLRRKYLRQTKQTRSYKTIKQDLNDEDVKNLIDDRLFRKRKYKAKGIFKKIDSVDSELYRHFIEQGFKAGLINKNLWYGGNLNWEAVKKLDEEAFLIFVQTNLGSSVDVKKKWMQRGLGQIFVIVVAVVLAYFGQSWLSEGLISLATAFTIWGIALILLGIATASSMLIEIGQFFILIGSILSLAGATGWFSTAVEEAVSEAVKQGVARGVAQRIVEKIAEETLLDQMLGVASQTFSYIGQAYSFISPFVQAYSIYEQIQSIFNQKMAEAPKPNETPEEAIRSVFMAENDYWDYINKHFPEYVIPATLKVM